MDDSAAIRVIRAEIPDVRAIYRFGSTAQGTHIEDSDVDLAVLGARPLEPVRRFELQEKLAVALGRGVDLVDLRAASTVMQMQVVSRGISIASLDPVEVARFEMYVYSAYARLNEERRGILQDVLERGSIHGR